MCKETFKRGPKTSTDVTRPNLQRCWRLQTLPALLQGRTFFYFIEQCLEEIYKVDNSSRIPFKGETGRVWATSIL